MLARLLTSTLMLALVAGYTSPAFADDNKTPGHTYAIIVGVGEFKDEQLKPRKTAVADAQALYDLMLNKEYVGSPPTDLHLLISGADEKRMAKEGTKANILAAIADVAKKADKNDTLLLFMIGQGASAGDKTCYFATDSTFKDRVKNAVVSNEIADAFKDSKCEKIFALYDLNFKGFDPGKETVAEAKLVDMMLTIFGVEKEDDSNLATGRASVFGSTSPTTLDLADHGIVTKATLDGLKGAADTEGEPDGVITVDELISYLEKTIPDLARTNGKTAEEKEQVPFALSRAAHFVLTHNPAVFAKVQERLTKLAKLLADGKIKKELAEEGERLMSRMPKLKSMRELRKSFEQLVDGVLAVPDFETARNTINEGIKLTEADARTFATKVLIGVETVTGNYIKKLERGDMINQAVTGMYRKLEEKLPDEIKEKLTKVKDLTRSELTELLIAARMNLGKREDLDDNKDVDTALSMMLTKLDPYTNYMDKESIKRLESQLKGQFTGIGIQIRRDLVKDGLLVVTPIKGSPAYKKGIIAGDLITKIIRPVDSEGVPLETPEIISTKGMKVDEAVKKILGKAGTPVIVEVEREGEKEPLRFDLKRARVEVESVLGWKRDKGPQSHDWNFYIDPESKIGYIHLTQFARNSFPDMLAAVRELKKDGLKGLILDLRFNPGGFLDTAVDICDLFVDDGQIVSIRPREQQERNFGGKHEGSELDFPMVVLVNGFSASGSEIVAACLQDHERAIIIGERSYGKGSVQNIAPFNPTGGEIKLTTATFWRPNGKNLNKSSIDGYDKMDAKELATKDWGVRPDNNYGIELTPQERGELELQMRNREIIGGKKVEPMTPDKKFEDRQLEKALTYLRSKINPTAQNTPKTTP